jgi:hypothetical protein
MAIIYDHVEKDLLLLAVMRSIPSAPNAVILRALKISATKEWLGTAKLAVRHAPVV